MSDIYGKFLASKGYAIKEAETTQIEEKGQDFSSANKELTKKLWEKQSGKNISAYTKGADIIQSELNKGLEKSTYDYAKQSFEAQYGKADDTTVEKWIKINQKKIEKDMYGALTQQALKDSVEFDKGTMYQDYISSYLETPKQKQSWGEKALDVGKSAALGLIDTAAGFTTSVADEVFGTRSYQGYYDLTGRTTGIAKDNDSFIDKMSNTLFTEYGLIDVAFGIGTFATAGTGAPVFASLSAAIKGGGKAIAKNAMKGGAEAVIETTLKKSFASSGDDIFQAIMKNSSASISELATKEGIDATTYMTRLRGALRNAGEEGLKKGSKEYKEYFKAVDQFTDVSGLGTSGVIRKQNRWIESIGDGLGLPTQFIKIGEKGGKRIYSASFMGLGLNAAIPATTLLPGVGEWFETTGLRLGGSVASMYVQQTRGGLIESERQKFMDQYGVDPEQSTGKLRSKWDEQINYKLRYALPSEILTGQSFAERSNGGKAVWGTVDMIANFAPVFGGIKGAGAAYGISQKYLSPIHMEENGNITSNIEFIKQLSVIQNSDFDESVKAEKIEILKQEVANGNPNLVTTIRGTKELERTVEELDKYVKSLSGGKNDIMASAFVNGLKEVSSLMSAGNMEGALAKFKETSIEQSEIGANVLSPEALNRVSQKVDILDTYFKKVRQDHGFLSNLTKQFVVNAFTTNVHSPSGAIIRGNEELIGAAKSVFSEMDTIAEVMSDTFSAKGRYIQNKFPQKSGEPHILDSRIETALRVAGLDPTKEMVIAFRTPLVTALAKTQFEMREFQDSTLEKVFDTVFSDYGLDVKKIGEEGGKSLGQIIMEINSMNVDEVIKISSRIEESMNAKIASRKADLASQQVFLQNNALQIAQMDRLYSELTNQLHVQHSRERIEGNEFVRTEEIPLREEIENLKSEIAKLKKSKQDTKIVEEDLKIMEEAFKDDPDATVVKDIPTDLNPNDSPTAAKMIATEEVQGAIREESEKTWKIYTSEARETQIKSEKLGMFFRSIKEANDRLFYAAQQVTVDKGDIDDMDEAIDKEVDNYYKNSQRIASYEDMLYRGISVEYNKMAKDFFGQKGEISLTSLREFNTRKNNLFGKELDKIKSDLIASAVDGKIPRNAKTRSLIRRGNEIIKEQTVRQFTREGVIRIATESSNAFDFVRNLRQEIKNTFKFTDEAVDKFMMNQFNVEITDGEISIGDMIPFYELYRKQEKIEVVRMNFDVEDVVTNENGKEVKTQKLKNSDQYDHYFSSEKPDMFLDDNGNTKLIRTRGIGADILKEKGDVVYLEDIYINGKKLDSYWSNGEWGGKNIDAKDRVDFFEENIMGPIVKEMESKGLIYLGAFQEEGKKTAFLRPKDPSYTYNDAMFDLTGLDWDKIDKLPDGEMKNSIAGNFQKYAKLIWWGEINANKGTWEQFIKIDETVPDLWKNRLHTMQGAEELIATLSVERDSQVRHLLIQDDTAKPEEYYTESEKASGKKIQEKISDGRTFNLSHYGRTLNTTTGANPHNQLYKTATNLGRGQFIKSQDIDASVGNFKDPQFIDAIYKSDDPKISAIVDFTIANFGDRWFDNMEAVKTVQELFQDFKVIDRIIPMSAYKNIFTRGKYLKENVPPIEFENYTVGGIIATDIKNIGVKAIDFSHTPKDIENENIKFANQVIRNIHEIRDTEGNILFSQKEANEINNTYNQIRKDDYNAILDFAEKVGYDPFTVIKEIEERFGVKFSDYQQVPFVNMNSVENLTKLMTNVMKRGTTSGTQLKGNQVDLTYPPDYWRIEHIAQQLIEPEFEHNFIILSKKYYGHIETDRAMMFRYPVVSDKVVNAPKIVWVENIEAQLGYKLDIGASGIPAINLIKRIEGDGDGDKMVLVTDPRLKKIQHLVEKYADAPKFQFEVSNTEANAKNTDRPIRDILNRTSYEIFYGKSVIGMIDNDQTRIEKFMQMGLIPNDKSNPGNKFMDPFSDPPKEFIGYRHDFLRQVMAKALQRAVDNKAVPMKQINEIIENSIGIKITDIKEHTELKRGEKLHTKKFDKDGYAVKDKDGKETNLVLEGPGPNGKKIYVWTISLINRDAESVKIVKALIHKANGRDDGIYKMNEKELEELQSVDATFLKNSMNKIQGILKKKQFLNDKEKDLPKEEREKIQNKSIELTQGEYIQIKKMYDRLVSIYGKDTINADPQMQFIQDMEASFLRPFPKQKIKDELSLTLNKALTLVKQDAGLNERETKALNKIRDLLSDYNKWDKEGTKESNESNRREIEQKMYSVLDEFEIDNFDNIIRNHTSSTTSPELELMTKKGRDELMNDINDKLVFTNLIRIGEYDPSVNLTKVWDNFGKVDSNELEKIFKDEAGEYLDNYFDPKRRLMRRDDVKPTIKTMVDMGMSMNEFYDFSETISNLETPVRERVVTNIKNLEEGDIKAFLDIAKQDSDMRGAVELLMSLGYKEIAGEKLVEKTHDAYTTVMNSPFNKPNC